MIKLKDIVMIHDLKRQGLSIAAIARETGFDRKTVRRHLARGLEGPSSRTRGASRTRTCTAAGHAAPTDSTEGTITQ